MNTLKNNNDGLNTELTVGPNMDLIELLINDPDTRVITDSNVYNSYKSLLHGTDPIVIPAGESSKDINTFVDIQKKLLQSGADRNTHLVAFGGGVVTDITGFVADTFLRGVKFTLVPTSLLAMIDAAIGGKTGINLDGYKNIIGTFSEPEKILIDPTLLETLPQIELLNGFSEAIKAALIQDEELLVYLENYSDKLIAVEQPFINSLINRCIDIKSNIVELDRKESGLRKLLNFGHTIGHAIERELQIPHGQAISIGIILESSLSHQEGLPESDLNRVKEVLELYKLPTEAEIDSNKIMNAIYKDKKKTKSNIDLIILKAIGEAYIHQMSFTELDLFLKSI